MDRPLANCYWVLPGRLLAGEHPYEGADAATRARLKRLLEAGIDAFLDLTHPGEWPEYRGLLPAAVQYLRSSIDDAGVPEEHAQMHAIVAHLQAALASGRRTYVHCRAGIGRTGLVVGCFLAEQSLDGSAALAELNRLWRQSARAMSWPEVPQTREQAEFIRSWPRHRQSLGDTQALAALRAPRARFQGCLLGLALGDALGVATQYRRAGSFAPLGDLTGGGPLDLPRGAWSDDTALALCQAESLLECAGFDAHDQLSRYARWQREGYRSATGQCLGITAASARAIAAAADAQRPNLLPRSDESAPLARVAPAVLYHFGDDARGIEAVCEAVQLFAPTPAVLDASRALAAMLQAALRAQPLARVLSPAPAAFGGQPLCAAVATLLGAAPEAPTAAVAEPAVAALAQARAALASGGGFRGGALQVANRGGDADVVGAVYGQLAGAHYGSGALPAPWLAALSQQGLISDIADQLLTAALLRLADADG